MSTETLRQQLLWNVFRVQKLLVCPTPPIMRRSERRRLELRGRGEGGGAIARKTAPPAKMHKRGLWIMRKGNNIGLFISASFFVMRKRNKGQSQPTDKSTDVYIGLLYMVYIFIYL